MKKISKEQELKRLSNKYFWEQKVTEIFLFILIAGLVILALYMSGLIMLLLNPLLNVPLLVAGMFGLLLFALVGLLICMIVVPIYFLLQSWIESNKEKAMERAEKELGI